MCKRGKAKIAGNGGEGCADLKFSVQDHIPNEYGIFVRNNLK